MCRGEDGLEVCAHLHPALLPYNQYDDGTGARQIDFNSTKLLLLPLKVSTKPFPHYLEMHPNSDGVYSWDLRSLYATR